MAWGLAFEELDAFLGRFGVAGGGGRERGIGGSRVPGKVRGWLPRPRIKGGGVYIPSWSEEWLVAVPGTGLAGMHR